MSLDLTEKRNGKLLAIQREALGDHGASA